MTAATASGSNGEGRRAATRRGLKGGTTRTSCTGCNNCEQNAELVCLRASFRVRAKLGAYKAAVARPCMVLETRPLLQRCVARGRVRVHLRTAAPRHRCAPHALAATRRDGARHHRARGLRQPARRFLHARRRLQTGNTLPLVGRPWGFNHWALQTNDGRSAWWFNGNDHEFKWIRCTHQPSPWIGDYGWFMVGPQMGGFASNPTGFFEPRAATVLPHVLDFRTAPDGMRMRTCADDAWGFAPSDLSSYSKAGKAHLYQIGWWWE